MNLSNLKWGCRGYVGIVRFQVLDIGEFPNSKTHCNSVSSCIDNPGQPGLTVVTGLINRLQAQSLGRLYFSTTDPSSGPRSC